MSDEDPMSSDQTGETARGRLSSGDLVLKDSLRHLDDEVICCYADVVRVDV